MGAGGTRAHRVGVISLCRVDDRLIHGQVVLGWGRRLGPERIVVVDDRIAADGWERELLAAATPPHVCAEFLSVREAAHTLSANGGPQSVFVLMETPATALRLAEAGYLVPVLNLGGLHRAGGFQVTPYLILLPEDFAALRALVARGTKIYAQDVPDAKRVEIAALLKPA